ncbi:MAG: hypothetical protein KGZ61_09715 [Sandarakinorhabdus sp.]|nr:hypothetical protein [Sandarakinorhabdus sp.]
MSLFLKDPDAGVDYRVDWTATLDGGVTVSASVWTVDPAEPSGLTVDRQAITAGSTTARLSGGIAGHVYRVGNRVTLSDGSVDERSLVVRVEER